MVQIIHEDLKLKCLKKRCSQQLTTAKEDSRLKRCKQVLNNFTEHISFTLFTDENVFTVAPPINDRNDRLDVSSSSKKRDDGAKRLLRARSTFSRSVMVFVAISQLGWEQSCSLLNPQ